MHSELAITYFYWDINLYCLTDQTQVLKLHSFTVQFLFAW